MCDSFLEQWADSTNWSCDKNKKSKSNVMFEERRDVCTNLLNEIDSNNQSPNVQMMAQEEMLVDFLSAYTHIHQVYKAIPRAVALAQKILFFELAYTLLAMQHTIPTFRHNDLSHYNVRTTVLLGHTVTVHVYLHGICVYEPRCRIGVSLWRGVPSCECASLCLCVWVCMCPCVYS